VSLSIVIPYYKRLALFTEAYRLNHSQFKAHQLVVVLDEPSEAAEVVSLLQSSNQRCKVIVNRLDHEWRSPTKAINVGIRHSDGDYVLVMSPESVCVTNVPIQLMWHATPKCFACGQVGRRERIAGQWRDTFGGAGKEKFYGSLCVWRAALEAIGSYDESITTWGSDPANIRARLRLYGLEQVNVPEARVAHIMHGEPRKNPKPAEERQRLAHPVSETANGEDWGREFNEVIWEQT
jgi:hypothetical protein